MFTLYKITVARVGAIEDFQPVLVSAAAPEPAMRAARAFIEQEYPNQTAPVNTVSDIDVICTTPDDVLDWA